MPTHTRKTCRSGQRCEPQSLVEAIDCVAHHSDLTLREIAERIGKSEAYLRTACSQYDDSHRFQADLIIPVTLATGNPTIIRFLARAVGGEFVALPVVLPGEAAETLRAVKAVREFGQRLESCEAALLEGAIDEREADEVVREGLAAVEAVLGLIECARAATTTPAPRPSRLRRVG